MFLRSRLPQLADLAEAFPLIQKRLRIPGRHAKNLLEFWTAMMVAADHMVTVIEDAEQPERSRMVAAAIAFCVPDDVVAHARGDAPPYPWKWMLDRWNQGHAVWVPRKEARIAQMAGGVNVLVQCYGLDSVRYSGLQYVQIQETLSEHFIPSMARRRVRHAIEEVCGPAERDRHKAFGLDVWRDYKEFKALPDWVACPEEQKPYMMGSDYRQLAQDIAKTNTAAGRMALLPEPRFGFTDLEQNVLALALRGSTDVEIAEYLGLTLVTIKKRWDRIFHKVEPFGALDIALSDDTTAGKQRRRVVLQMMKEHPEEFWAQAR